MPKISVIMPVYNNSSYIRQSIESVLNQTHKDIEFIIIDDGSTEPIWEIINSYNDCRIIRIRNDNNIGLTKSINKGLKIATGDYIARQDSDDISLLNRFEEQLKYFTGNVGLVMTWAYAIDVENRRLSHYYLDKDSRIETISEIDIRKQNYLVCPTAMFSRLAYNKIGLFDENLYLAQGYNYWMRIIKFFDIKIVPKELYIMKKHEKSVRNMHPEFTGVDWIKKCRECADKCPIIN